MPVVALLELGLGEEVVLHKDHLGVPLHKTAAHRAPEVGAEDLHGGYDEGLHALELGAVHRLRRRREKAVLQPRQHRHLPVSTAVGELLADGRSKGRSGVVGIDEPGLHVLVEGGGKDGVELPLHHLGVDLGQPGLAQRAPAHDGQVRRGDVLHQPADATAHEVQHLLPAARPALHHLLIPLERIGHEFIVELLVEGVVGIAHPPHVGLLPDGVLVKIAPQILHALPQDEQPHPYIGNALGVPHLVHQPPRDDEQLLVVMVKLLDPHLVFLVPPDLH